MVESNQGAQDEGHAAKELPQIGAQRAHDEVQVAKELMQMLTDAMTRMVNQLRQDVAQAESRAEESRRQALLAEAKLIESQADVMALHMQVKLSPSARS